MALKNQREGWTISLYQEIKAKKKKQRRRNLQESVCSLSPSFVQSKLLSEALRQSKLERAHASECPQRAGWMLAGGSVS